MTQDEDALQVKPVGKEEEETEEEEQEVWWSKFQMEKEFGAVAAEEKIEHGNLEHRLDKDAGLDTPEMRQHR